MTTRTDLLYVDLPCYTVVHPTVVDLHRQVPTLVESPELGVRRVWTLGERLSGRQHASGVRIVLVRYYTAVVS